MKKILFTLFLTTSIAQAADKLQVVALNDFNTINPTQEIKVQVLKEDRIEDLIILKNDLLFCELNNIKAPTRGKRDAKIYFKIKSYQDSKGIHEIKENYIARYSKTTLNIEEIKKIPPKKVVKKTAGFIGDQFMLGFSQALSFVDGAKTNTEGNRIKSGAKQVYDDSILSFIKYGNEIDIKKGDVFYLIVKEEKE